MGSKKRVGNPNTGTAEPTTKRRRRRRNIRTANVSSSSSSSDSDSDSDGSNSGNESDRALQPSKRARKPANSRTLVEAGETGEVQMADAPLLALPESGGSSGESEQDDGDDEGAPPKTFTQKNRIPSPLRQLHDPLADARFQEYYMHQLTAEFGDELNALRSAKDFGGGGSLAMLVNALKLGVNIFDPAQKRLVVDSVAAKE